MLALLHHPGFFWFVKITIPYLLLYMLLQRWCLYVVYVHTIGRYLLT